MHTLTIVEPIWPMLQNISKPLTCNLLGYCSFISTFIHHLGWRSINHSFWNTLSHDWSYLLLCREWRQVIKSSFYRSRNVTNSYHDLFVYLFVGDTLFVGGCGRFFEGTAEQMYHALCEVLATLPPETVNYSHSCTVLSHPNSYTGWFGTRLFYFVSLIYVYMGIIICTL